MDQPDENLSVEEAEYLDECLEGRIRLLQSVIPSSFALNLLTLRMILRAAKMTSLPPVMEIKQVTRNKKKEVFFLG